MTTSESKGRFFFTKRIDSHNESNRFESRIGMLYSRDRRRYWTYAIHTVTAAETRTPRFNEIDTFHENIQGYHFFETRCISVFGQKRRYADDVGAIPRWFTFSVCPTGEQFLNGTSAHNRPFQCHDGTDRHTDRHQNTLSVKPSFSANPSHHSPSFFFFYDDIDSI